MNARQLADPVVQFVSDFRECRVLVLGDAILDEYLLGDCSRISPEAPVPVLKVNSCRQVLGGAANTAANIVTLGGHATLIGLVGLDEAGRSLRRHASAAGVELLAIDPGVATLRKVRVVGHYQQIVRLDYEERRAPDPSIESEILSRFEAAIGDCDIVVISDYGKGFLSRALAEAIISRAHDVKRQVIVDPRPQNRACYAGGDYLTPNWKESRGLLQLPEAEPTPDEAAMVAQALAASLDTNVVLTLGAQGIRFCSRTGAEQFAVATLAREVFDVSGAGDTVVAAFALSRAAGADHATAVAIANRAASIAVAKFGTATVTADEMLKDVDGVRLVSRQGLAPLASTLRDKGKSIVTLTGVFDSLDGRHLHMLSQARELADVLIVGLHSDASVRSREVDRPCVAEAARAEMLLALRMVDYVHVFDEVVPFLNEIKPDVHVTGADHGELCVHSATVTRSARRADVVRRVQNFSQATPVATPIE